MTSARQQGRTLGDDVGKDAARAGRALPAAEEAAGHMTDVLSCSIRIGRRARDRISRETSEVDF